LTPEVEAAKSLPNRSAGGIAAVVQRRHRPRDIAAKHMKGLRHSAKSHRRLSRMARGQRLKCPAQLLPRESRCHQIPQF
jgi:hypothetical protein